jgi:hypothetical protein
MKNTQLLEKTIEIANLLGFKYRSNGGDWVTFTYPNTNSYVIYIGFNLIDDITTEIEIMKKLGDELVKCGRIQLRQELHKILNPLNYD